MSLSCILLDAPGDRLAAPANNLTVMPHDHVINLLGLLRVRRIAPVNPNPITWVLRIGPPDTDPLLRCSVRPPTLRHPSTSSTTQPPVPSSCTFCGNSSIEEWN
jgi:hypothetical protein